jgi:hypothetical protein
MRMLTLSYKKWAREPWRSQPIMNRLPSRRQSSDQNSTLYKCGS